MISCGLTDKGGLGTTERICSVLLGTQPNRRNPFIDQSRVLSSAEMPLAVNSARERIVLDTAAAALQPREQTCPSVCGDLELHRPAGLLLDQH